MRMKHPFLSSMALAAALAAPAGMSMITSLQAQVAVQVKIYDRNHKDYHVWDDNEDRAYRGYLVDQHQEYRPYAKMKRADQNKYWDYRHAHPDEHK
jgi:hypothetical protein